MEFMVIFGFSFVFLFWRIKIKCVSEVLRVFFRFVSLN